MTHMSINISHQKWLPQIARRNQRRYKNRWKAFASWTTSKLRLRRRRAKRRAYHNRSLDQLSDHELKDIGLIRDQFGYPRYTFDYRAISDHQYGRFRRLPGE